MRVYSVEALTRVYFNFQVFSINDSHSQTYCILIPSISSHPSVYISFFAILFSRLNLFSAVPCVAQIEFMASSLIFLEKNENEKKKIILFFSECMSPTHTWLLDSVLHIRHTWSSECIFGGHKTHKTSTVCLRVFPQTRQVYKTSFWDISEFIFYIFSLLFSPSIHIYTYTYVFI